MQEEVIVAGFGGQGIMFMGRLLAHAAMQENKNVTFFPSYGAEMRGGTANCTVVISDEEIGSPVVKHPHSIIVLNQPSTDRFLPRIKDKGILVVNSSLVHDIDKRDGINIVKIEASRIAESLGEKKVANMVAVGSYIKKTGILKLVSLKESLKILLGEKKKNLIDINIKALEHGYNKY
ncbi:MAG: 2-oxoacid:acceptor oxidoreductase family protein [bacterium]